MQYEFGIDLPARDSYLCIIDEKDRIQLREKAPNDLETIIRMLDRFCPRPAVVVEATPNWYWLIDGLQETRFEVKLARTLGLYMITGAKVKTDRRDALSLARLLRLEAIPEAYIYPKDTRPIRDFLRRRRHLVLVRAAMYRFMRNVLLQHGFYGYPQGALKGLDEEQILEHLDHPVLQTSMQMELQRIDLYTRQIRILEEMILSRVKEEPVFKPLQTVPGVGKILAMTRGSSCGHKFSDGLGSDPMSVGHHAKR